MGGKVSERRFLAIWCPGKVDKMSQLLGCSSPQEPTVHRMGSCDGSSGETADIADP